MRILLLFFFFISFNNNYLDAQTPANEEDKFFHLANLKQGVLFVEIPNLKKRKIELLEESYNKRDEKILNKEKEFNARLQNEVFAAFNKYFDYCPVYFYHSNHKSNILSKNYEGIIMNYKQEIIDIEIDSITPRYLANYGRGQVAADTDKYNGEGFQIHYINGTEIQGIKSSIFFEVDPKYFSMIYRLANLKDWEIKVLKGGVLELNRNLHRARNSILPFLLVIARTVII